MDKQNTVHRILAYKYYVILRYNMRTKNLNEK